MKAAAEASGAELNYDCSVEEVFFEGGAQIKSFKVIKPLLSCDAVISVGKLKTHEMMTFTGAAKNLFGIVPGLTKTEYHYRMSSPEDFANMLVDIAEFARPVLSVIDAVWGMEGEGPALRRSEEDRGAHRRGQSVRSRSRGPAAGWGWRRKASPSSKRPWRGALRRPGWRARGF